MENKLNKTHFYFGALVFVAFLLGALFATFYVVPASVVVESEHPSQQQNESNIDETTQANQYSTTSDPIPLTPDVFGAKVDEVIQDGLKVTVTVDDELTGSFTIYAAASTSVTKFVCPESGEGICESEVMLFGDIPAGALTIIRIGEKKSENEIIASAIQVSIPK